MRRRPSGLPARHRTRAISAGQEIRHVRSFAQILTERQGQRLPEWLDAVRQDDLPGLHTLAAGIDRDRAAVIAGLTLPWNSGVVEGHVNRIKMLKRQMFGRAGFALLRKRVLLAPSLMTTRETLPTSINPTAGAANVQDRRHRSRVRTCRHSGRRGASLGR
ncbi:transposase [Streptomyces anulatus]|nr:transposase [Streptomyces anulatus]MCX4503970.1 transposase [Streptomyces anulatus]